MCFSLSLQHEHVRLKVHLGRHNRDISNSNEITRSVSDIIKHPSYNSKTSDNDLCLLKLSSPVTFNNYISPVCLAGTGNTPSAGTAVWVTGWGTMGLTVKTHTLNIIQSGVTHRLGLTLHTTTLTLVEDSSCPLWQRSSRVFSGCSVTSRRKDQVESSERREGFMSLPYPGPLQEVSVPVVSQSTCDSNYSPSGITITNNMLCAGQKGKDSCQGDSGGPLVLKLNGSWYQPGVVSFGIGCALAQYPGVYAKVSNYQTWIAGNTSPDSVGFMDSAGNTYNQAPRLSVHLPLLLSLLLLLTLLHLRLS
ncbi:hypothetical protein WMY93_001614 [Mugilogobius chulae]|uniref:Peptidase S1 domain-containing protein n=1 Tax=Mugilogobius chulae TaxID=88201 RepID=A0AAW0PRG7_9GOBI